MNAWQYLTSSGLIRTGPGSLKSVLLTGGSAAATLTIYDNTAASGDVLAVLKAPANDSRAWFPADGVVVSIGIYGELSGTGAVATIVY